MKKAIMFCVVIFIVNSWGFTQTEKRDINKVTVIPFVGFGCYDAINKDCSTPKKETLELISTTKDYLSPLELGFQLKKELNCSPNCSDIERLANKMGLTSPSIYNPNLAYNIGDITFWGRQDYSIDNLILEFAALKAALEALDHKKFTLAKHNRNDNLQGKLRDIANTIKENDSTGIKEKWIELRKEYNNCKEGESIICTPLEKRMFIIRTFRFQEVEDLISNSPYKGNIKIQLGDVKALAKYFQIPPYGSYNCDPSLMYDEGDFQFFADNYSAEQINKEFVSRKIFFDAADMDNQPCLKLTKPDISYIVENFIISNLPK